METDFQPLLAAARGVLGEYRTDGVVVAGTVGAALLTDGCEVFTGVCFDAACGICFCAEHAAVAEMLKHRRSRVRACVAVGLNGRPMPPCGRCRELLYQLSPANLDAEILVEEGRVRRLRDLLPDPWHYA